MLDKLYSAYFLVAQSSLNDRINLPNKVSPSDGTALSSRIETILQIVFVTMGAVSVLIIAIAGLQYVMSGGDPQKTGRAKDTILYAVIGLVVAISAFAIVTFVIGRIF